MCGLHVWSSCVVACLLCGLPFQASSAFFGHRPGPGTMDDTARVVDVLLLTLPKLLLPLPWKGVATPVAASSMNMKKWAMCARLTHFQIESNYCPNISSQAQVDRYLAIRSLTLQLREQRVPLHLQPGYLDKGVHNAPIAVHWRSRFAVPTWRQVGFPKGNGIL